MKGVNRLVLFIVAFCLVMPIAFSVVEIKGFVNDYADVISTAEEQELDSILNQIYDSGKAQYSIVTINSLEGIDIESYSLEVAQGNLGDTEKNNGLLLLISIEDKKYRFEVGRGIEYILNDAKVGRIGRNYLTPNFQAGDYGKGIVEASLAVKSVLLGDNASEYYVTGEEIDYDQYESLFTTFFFLLFFVILPLLSSIFYKKNKSKNKFFNAALGAVILFGGGRRGGGSGRGGFGGFGGGGFGGGGASSSW